MNLNDIYEVTITSLDHQGRGIAKINDLITFIPNTLPNEVVKIKITNIKKNYLEAELLEILKKDSKRIDPICPYYDECGGCDLMHMAYENQAEYKENKVKNIMKRYADLECVYNIVKCDNPLNYRNKVTFQVKSVIGMYRKKSYDITPIDKCLLVDDKINDYLNILKNKDLKGINQIVIKTSIDDTMIIFICDKDIDIDISDLNCNVIKKYNDKYIVLKGQNYITDYIGDKIYKISPSSFFQINSKQVKKLYDKVVEYLDLKNTDFVLDLYCGTGTIGIYLANYVNKVLGIEINKEAIIDARENAKLNNISNIEFIAGDTGKIIENLDVYPNKIVVDPPRTGLDKKVISKLITMKPQKIVYVSCDPVTLARDLNLLKEFYTVEKITPVDMFCQTMHVESVCCMSKK